MRKWITIGIGMGLLATAACANVNDDTALSRTPIPTKDVNTITCGIEPDRNEVGIYRYRVFCQGQGWAVQGYEPPTADLELSLAIIECHVPELECRWLSAAHPDCNSPDGCWLNRESPWEIPGND